MQPERASIFDRSTHCRFVQSFSGNFNNRASTIGEVFIENKNAARIPTPAALAIVRSVTSDFQRSLKRDPIAKSARRGGGIKIHERGKFKLQKFNYPVRWRTISKKKKKVNSFFSPFLSEESRRTRVLRFSTEQRRKTKLPSTFPTLKVARQSSPSSFFFPPLPQPRREVFLYLPPASRAASQKAARHRRKAKLFASRCLLPPRCPLLKLPRVKIFLHVLAERESISTIGTPRSRASQSDRTLNLLFLRAKIFQKIVHCRIHCRLYN